MTEQGGGGIDLPHRASGSASPRASGDNSAPGEELSECLTALADLGLEDLRIEWSRLYRATPPRLSRDLLLRSIAHRLQEEALGGLAPATQRRLAAMARVVAGAAPPTAAPATVKFKAGTTLVREWHGRTHTVLVRETGFEHEGKHYASLTQIARAITGAHWSGPRFFGLRRGKPNTSPGAAEHG